LVGAEEGERDGHVVIANEFVFVWSKIETDEKIDTLRSAAVDELFDVSEMR
jgi:hypothetical protein